MTLNLTSLPKATARCACRCGALLLPFLAVRVEALVMPQRVTVIGHGSIVVVERPTPRPYLVAVGPVAFRFAPAPPPQAAQPPPPSSTKLAPVVAPPEPPPAPPPVVAAPAVKVEPPQEVHETQTSAPILPDDTKREIRAEDVLPFFQFPNGNAASGGGVVPPFAPAQPRGPALPPSSATYQQK